MFNIRGYQENTQKPYNDNLCLFNALVLRLHGRNFQIFQSIPRKNWWDWSCKPLRCFYGRFWSSGGYCSGRYFLVRYWLCKQIYDWGARVSGNALILYGYYVIIATLAMSPISTLSSKPIVVHRVINSSKGLSTWSDIWLLAKRELNIFFQKMCINCKKHYLTN